MSYCVVYLLNCLLTISWPLYQAGRASVFLVYSSLPIALRIPALQYMSKDSNWVKEWTKGMGSGEQKQWVGREVGCDCRSLHRTMRGAGSKAGGMACTGTSIRPAWLGHRAAEKMTYSLKVCASLLNCGAVLGPCFPVPLGRVLARGC